MRILQLLTHDRFESGGSFQALLLARGLRRRGHEVTVAVDSTRGGSDEQTRSRVAAIDCEFAEVELRGGLRGWLGTRRLRQLFERGRFDIVHLHRDSALKRFLGIASRLPAVAAIANIGTSTAPDAEQCRRLASPAISRVVVVAEAIRELLIARCSIDPRRVVTLYGGFDEERFSPSVAPLDRECELGIPADAHVAGVVANLDKKKGIGEFLDAARRVIEIDPKAYFVWVGGGDVETLRRRALETSPELHRRLIALGFRNDVPALLRTFDVSFSSSTRGEGITGAIRESMAVGVPVVATDVGGNREIVRPGATGWLVPPKDPEALANALLEAFREPQRAAEYARAGYRRVAEDLTSARRAAHAERIYLESLADRGLRAAPALESRSSDDARVRVE